jgi:hypothetical protein
MAGLTKDELKSALIAHGVEQNLSAAKKDELVELYEEFVAPHDEKAGEFSSDDENLESPVTRSSNRASRSRLSPRVSAKAVTPKVSAKAESPQKSPRVSAKAPTPRVSEKAPTPKVSAKAASRRSSGKAPTPRVSAKASNGAINVNELNDEELRESLTKHGIEVGPIVDSTRPLYEKKLSAVLEGGDEVDAASEEEVNGTDLDESVAEFSADEEEEVAETEEVVADEATEEEEDSDDQPSVVVKEATPKPASNTSPLANLGQSIRQRFSGSGSAEKPKSDRFTPTPRRSIHSYKVVETSRKTVTKDKDGNITEDTTVDKVTSETDSKIEPAGRIARLIKVLPGILMLLILAALAYYVTSKRK